MPETNSEKKYLDKTGLSYLIGKLIDKFSALGHKHKIEDLEDYTVDTSLSDTSENPVQNKVINAEFERINDTLAEKTQVQIITWEADD